MAIRVVPGYKEQLIKQMMVELAADKERREQGDHLFQSDICDWSQHNFYIPTTLAPVWLPLHQRAILRLFFTRDETNHFPYQNAVYSTVKKSGKSTTGGMIGRWFAETQTRYGEIYAIGNDLEQAKDRAYKEIVRSLELTPGYDRNRDRLPGRWDVHKLSMRCLLTGSMIKAVAVDAKGEAGGQPTLSIWTELWGFEETDAKRFWDEMTPIPTVPDSLRVVETYAGYDGESDLLHGLYDIGMDGRQMTAGELAAKVCREGVPGEEFQDYVDCWRETRGNPDVKIPIWTNGRFAMYWDSGMIARRMPWQHMFVGDGNICEDCLMVKGMHEIGIPASEYYADQETTLPVPAYRRLHLNEWVGSEGAFVPMELWDACGHVHEIPTLQDGDMNKLIASMDAAVTGDCFGVLVVERCPFDSSSVDVRAVKKWDPRETGGVINLEEPETFMRAVCQVNNIIQITYDPFQLENTAQRLRKEGIVWIEPFNQAGERLKADSQLYDMIISKRIHYHHDQGCPGNSLCSCSMAPLREHVSNANGKLQVNEDSKVRIVKKAAGRKIDLCVCLSMAASRCLYLRVANGES